MKSFIGLGVILVSSAALVARAGDCRCCDHCGCEAPCHKVCRVVCETKKVPKVEYSCECEDFCVPGPSHCSTYCDECGHKQHVYTPTCAKVRTRTKLVKKETTTEKKTYKWVVENVCCNCADPPAQEPAPKSSGTSPTSRFASDPSFEAPARRAAYEAPSAKAAPQAQDSEVPGGRPQLRFLLEPALRSR